jgi:hypothetical protein
MSNLSDPVGGADLYNGLSYSFTTDRFGNANSAIYFNSGYLQVPPGIYFAGDFTVTAWIYLYSYESFSRIFDFASSVSSDNVLLGMYDTTSALTANILNGGSYSTLEGDSYVYYYSGPTLIQLNAWYHVAFVLSGTTGNLYLNGILLRSGTLFVPNRVTRDSNL